MGLTCILSRKLSTAVPGSAKGEAILPWDGRDLGQQTSSKKRVCPVTAEHGNTYLTIWNTFTADWSRSQLVSHLLWWGSNSISCFFSALTHPLPLQLPYQQDWEHWFPQTLSQQTETNDWNRKFWRCLLTVWRITRMVWQQNPKNSLRKLYGHGKDREIRPWMELNMYYSDGPLWAIRHPGKDGEIMEVKMYVKLLLKGACDT